MEGLLDNAYILTVVYYVIALIFVVIFLWIFQLLTKFKDWEQIKKGNAAVSLAMVGKIIGIATILKYSIEHNDTLPQMMVWGTFGFALLIVTYYIFEFMTPFFKVDEQLERGNIAVGILSMGLSIAASLIVGASLT